MGRIAAIIGCAALLCCLPAAASAAASVNAGNVDFADATGGSRFCFTLGASVYSHQPGRDASATYAPHVCIS